MPAQLEKLEVLYLQDFDGSNANPICQGGKSYATALFKQFSKLRGLDGYRKAVECISMKDAVPALVDDEFKYECAHIQWFDSKELEKENPQKGLFEDSVEVRREENALTAILKDCNMALAKKDHVTKL